MPETGDIVTILYQDGGKPDFAGALSGLAQNGAQARLAVFYVRASESQILRQCREAGFARANIHCQQLADPEDWQAAATRYLRAAMEPYALLLSSACRLWPAAITEMRRVLEADAAIGGVNPLFLDGRGHIAHLGTVANSQGALQYLYEGISAEHPLAQKQRMFRFAQPAALLLRLSAFQAARGIEQGGQGVDFFSFCLRLCARHGLFATAPKAKADFANNLQAIIPLEIWNSFILRGKIPAKWIRPDLHAHARADGLECAATPWLHEDVVNAGLWDQANPWLAWRHDPSPATLLAWLAALDEAALRKALPIIRNIPAFLPLQFRHYEVLARSIGEFARAHGLQDLERGSAKWQKSARSFHYRQLIPGMKMLRKAGLYNASLDFCAASYDAWLELEPQARPAALQAQADWPKIAVIMPVYDSDPDFLRQAIDSVIAQSYDNWELCIADDASPNPQIRAILEDYCRRDARIRVVFRKENGHISRATNSALELAGAPWLAFMDHDDLLAPDALAFVAKACAENPHLVLIYSDVDQIDANNVRRSPFFKPDFEPVRCEAFHLCVYSANAVRGVGGLRPGLDGSQDHDLCLRVTENCRPRQIKHIPRILYHWRIHPGSATMGVSVKPYVLEATRRAKNDAAKRRQLAASAVPGIINNSFYYQWHIPPALDCALILLAGESGIGAELAHSLRALANICGVELFWQPLAENARPRAAQKHWPRLQALPFAGACWREACNSALRHIEKPFLFFLDADLRPERDCKPEQLPLMLAQSGLALVGGVIWRGETLVNAGFYPDIDGAPFPLLAGLPRGEASKCNYTRLATPHECIGVHWRCMAVNGAALRAQGGFAANMGDWALVDFCMRQRQAGLSAAISPWGQWQSAQARNALPALAEREAFLAKWRADVANCPLRNASLRAASDNDWMLRIEE